MQKLGSFEGKKIKSATTIGHLYFSIQDDPEDYLFSSESSFLSPK